MRDVDVGRDTADVGRDVVLQLRQVGQRFGATEVLRGLDLSVYRGERLAIIGPNGAGKSTLFNLISGRTPPSSGSIWLHGQRVDGLPPFEIHRRGLARSFQITNLFPRLSVYDNLRCATLWSLGYRYTWWRRLSQLRDANARTEHWLHQMRLHTRRDVPAMHLSYAEQRALELGITLAGGADVVLLDEPTAGMSQSETRHFVALIHEVTQGKTLLVVEHDMSVVFRLADRVAVLVNGELLALDSPAAVRANPAVQAAYLGTGWDMADAGGQPC
ncbi:MAG: hypothetical protein RLZZ352_956 [Pseudomonadota bacterium]|jgi:branched-chain amino acid transport system ATP-binding protein